MKSALALVTLSFALGTAHSKFEEALQQHELLPTGLMSRLAAPAAPALHLLDVVRVTARKHGVAATLVKSIIKAESAFRSNAVSPKGAIGLMQLMPDTAQEYGAINPHVPEQNIDAGTKYLGWLLKRYENRKNTLSLAIAAYNAGPGNVDKYRGIPPFAETRTYVKRVMNYQRELEGLPPVTEQEAGLRPAFRKGAKIIAFRRSGRSS